MGYILITPGNLKNKGAQSMIFVTVDEMRKRFPGKEIVSYRIRTRLRRLKPCRNMIFCFGTVYVYMDGNTG